MSRAQRVGRGTGHDPDNVSSLEPTNPAKPAGFLFADCSLPRKIMMEVRAMSKQKRLWQAFGTTFVVIGSVNAVLSYWMLSGPATITGKGTLTHIAPDWLAGSFCAMNFPAVIVVFMLESVEITGIRGHEAELIAAIGTVFWAITALTIAALRK